MNDKMIFGAYVIAIVAILQAIAWIVGYNGAVFAFTSFIVGSIAGGILGFKFSLKRNPPS